MALKVDLPKELMLSTFATKKQSLSRGVNTATNPVIRDAFQKELVAITNAEASMTEIK